MIRGYTVNLPLPYNDVTVRTEDLTLAMRKEMYQPETETESRLSLALTSGTSMWSWRSLLSLVSSLIEREVSGETKGVSWWSYILWQVITRLLTTRKKLCYESCEPRSRRHRINDYTLSRSRRHRINFHVYISSSPWRLHLLWRREKKESESWRSCHLSSLTRWFVFSLEVTGLEMKREDSCI